MATKHGEIDHLMIEVNKMKNDISDFIGEISYTSTPARAVLSELRKYRLAYRTKFFRLRHFLGRTVVEKQAEDYDTLIEKIRDEISNAINILIEATQLQPIELKTTNDLDEAATFCEIESTDHKNEKKQESFIASCMNSVKEKLQLCKEHSLAPLKEESGSYLYPSGKFGQICIPMCKRAVSNNQIATNGQEEVTHVPKVKMFCDAYRSSSSMLVIRYRFWLFTTLLFLVFNAGCSLSMLVNHSRVNVGRSSLHQSLSIASRINIGRSLSLQCWSIALVSILVNRLIINVGHFQCWSIVTLVSMLVVRSRVNVGRSFLHQCWSFVLASMLVDRSRVNVGCSFLHQCKSIVLVSMLVNRFLVNAGRSFSYQC